MSLLILGTVIDLGSSAIFICDLRISSKENTMWIPRTPGSFWGGAGTWRLEDMEDQLPF